MIRMVYSVYFSPCGNVKKAVGTAAAAAAEKLGAELRSIDFTLPGARAAEYGFSEGDLVFFGTPVYAGRVPNKIMPFIREAFRGNGALCVPMVCFGNRSFGDALSELKLLLEAGGFIPVSAAAAVAEHSFSAELASSRPDMEDLHRLAAFGAETAQKALSVPSGDAATALSVPGTQSLEDMKYYTPLRSDGLPAKFLKASPELKKELCDLCGVCERVCPMGSIDLEAEGRMAGPCIKCQACIKSCPRGALYFSDPDFLSHVKMLEENYARRAEPLFVL